MRRNMIITLIIVMMISGCSRVPKLDSPDIERVDDIVTEKSAETELEFNSSNWWTIYNDEDLDTMVDMIIKSNLDLDMAQINIKKAGEGISRIRGAKMPTAELYGSAKRLKIEDSSPSSLEGARADIFSGGLMVNYDFDFFHKIDSLEKSQEFLVKGRYLQEDLVRLEVTTLTTQLYGYYIYTDKVDENLNGRLSLLNEVKVMTLKGIEAGQNIENDLLRIDNKINDLKGAIAENILSQNNTVESLNLLSDYKNTEEIKGLLGRAVKRSEILGTELPLPERIASTVVSNRPDVRYYLMIIQSQKYKLKSIEADYYPQFSITGNLNETKIDLRNGFSPSAMAWSLGPKVYLPIFNMSQIDADYRVGGLELEEFIREYDKTLMTSFKNINVELAANKTSKSTLALKEENLRNSDKIVRDGELELKLGYISEYKQLLRRYDNLVTGMDRELSSYSAYKEQVSLINSLGGVYRRPASSEENQGTKIKEA